MKTKFYLIAAFALFAFNAFAQTECAWTGAVDASWQNEANWNNLTVPGPLDQAVIYSGSIAPALQADAVIGNLVIGTGASLDLGTFNLEVSGNWTNSGTLVAGTGTVKFTGNQAQQITGSQEFYHLEINNVSGVSIVSGQTSVKGVVTISAGNFETNDSLILLSDENGTGSIGPLVNGTLTGEITMQRYLSESIGDWRFISSPVSDATLLELNDDCWTAGFAGSTYPSSSFVSVYFYDETLSGTADIGYQAPTSISQSLQPGVGFMVYVDSTSLVEVLDFTGTPNMGTIEVPVTYTLTDTVSDGWNLVGNPYPSAINWDDSSLVKTGIYNAVYIWNPTAGVYSSYVDGIGANGGSPIVSAGRSFYVATYDTTAQLIFSENNKTSASTQFLKSGQAPVYFSMGMINSYGEDEAIIRSNEAATDGFDGAFDAMKMWSPNWNLPAIYTMDTEDVYYSINQLAPGEKMVPIYVYTGASEMHTFTFEGVDAFQDAGCVLLEDLHTGIFYDLATTTSFDAFVSDTTTAARFMLHIGAAVTTSADDETCYGNNDGEIAMAKNSDQLYDATLFDVWGGLVANETGIYQVAQFNDLSSGIYIVQLTDNICGVLSDTLVINQPSPVLAAFTVSEDTVFQAQDPVEISFINESASASSYTWEFGSYGSASSTDAVFSFADAGTHTVTLYAYQSPTCYAIHETEITVISTLGTDPQTDLEVVPVIYMQNSQLVIQADQASRIEVRSMTGQLIYAGDPSGSETRIDLQRYAAQVFVVAVYCGERVFTEKVLQH
jgi:hypothetical protein